VLPWIGSERSQTTICCLEWLGRFNCVATGLDACLLSFSRVFSIGIGRLVVSLLRRWITFSKKCKLSSRWRWLRLQVKRSVMLMDRFVPDIFSNVTNERTCFATSVRAFKSSKLITYLECTEYQELYSGWFSNPLHKRTVNRHRLNLVVKKAADYSGTSEKAKKQTLEWTV